MDDAQRATRNSRVRRRHDTSALLQGTIILADLNDHAD